MPPHFQRFSTDLYGKGVSKHASIDRYPYVCGYFSRICSGLHIFVAVKVNIGVRHGRDPSFEVPLLSNSRSFAFLKSFVCLRTFAGGYLEVFLYAHPHATRIGPHAQGGPGNVGRLYSLFCNCRFDRHVSAPATAGGDDQLLPALQFR